MLLPLLLALAVVLGLGSYFETSDDGTLAWLFSGVLALQPVVSVPLYLHGYGHLLAAAYTAAPAGPWLGLLLAGLLAAATALWFAVLERLLRAHFRPGWLTLALVLFFGLAWLEHWLWFSHARVALLLAAGGVLFAAQRPGQRWPLLLGLAALLAAWLVRPGLAALAVAAAAPAAMLLAGSARRAAPPLLAAGVLLALAFGLAALNQTPAEACVQARDVRLARILDYEQLSAHPRTAADSLGIAAIGCWLLGDSAVVDPVLRGSVYRFEPADFAGRVLPAKLAVRAGLLLRDYFPVLLALLATAVATRRQRRAAPGKFWLVQLCFATGLAGLAGLLKLPPRLALPLLDCWLLTNLVFWRQSLASGTSVAAVEHADAASAVEDSHSAPQPVRKGRSRRFPLLPDSPLTRNAGAAALLLVSGLYAAKTWHRHQVLRHEQEQHEIVLAQIRAKSGTIRVLGGTSYLLKSLSPYHTYSLGSGPVLQLTGWPSHDPSQVGLRRALTGTADQAECLLRLARRAGPGDEVVWFLIPRAADWLNWRLGSDSAALSLVPAATSLPAPLPWLVRRYRVQRFPKP